jgi:hypothetical protein
VVLCSWREESGFAVSNLVQAIDFYVTSLLFVINLKIIELCQLLGNLPSQIKLLCLLFRLCEFQEFEKSFCIWETRKDESYQFQNIDEHDYYGRTSPIVTREGS